jgi:hypothetical protein
VNAKFKIEGEIEIDLTEIFEKYNIVRGEGETEETWDYYLLENLNNQFTNLVIRACTKKMKYIVEKSRKPELAAYGHHWDINILIAEALKNNITISQIDKDQNSSGLSGNG